MRINRKNTCPLMKHGWPRIVVLLLTLVMSCAAVGAEGQEKLLHTLKAGIDEYLRDVEFKCTYTHSKYLVDSKEEAERFDTSGGKLLLRATGSLIKSKTMTFESFVLDPETGSTSVENHVTVTNSDLNAQYFKQGEGAANRTLFVCDEKKGGGRRESAPSTPRSGTDQSIVCVSGASLFEPLFLLFFAPARALRLR